ncbi:ABC transporter permease [Occallatibacter savannae]|uniref:ABC transporter permease n=1 Tax=Occallatibacter savannae TaxID=1002691 RepID=UPI000D69697B|nr:ABC transporter permease [Occallatibacter savannae]
MRRLRAFWMRLGALLGSVRAQSDFDAELESHIAEHARDGVAAGLSETEARRDALLRLGGAEQARQAYRDRATLPAIESVVRDVRYALRGFRRSPVFALAAVVTLALGIGATTAVFSVVDRILFRSLPYAHDDRLVSIGLAQSLERQEFTLGGFFYEWRDNQRPFESMTFERGAQECNLTENNPLHLECAIVAQNFLSTLGVSVEAGRNFVPEEDVPHGPRSVIISDALWLSRFNRSPDVVTRSIEIDDELYRIVGVLPRGFEMPRLQAADLLMPAQTDIAAQHTVNAGIGYPMWAFARLKPGITVAEAKAEMTPLFLHTQQWIPAEIRKDFRLEVRSLRDRQMQNAYLAAKVLLGAVFAVLLIACANMTGLLSARRAARARELAVRSALGATRVQLLVQELTESLVLGAFGTVLGCGLAAGLLCAFIAIAPAGIPFMGEARIDNRVIGFTIFVAFISACVTGVIPAMERTGVGALMVRAGSSGQHARLRNITVVLQIAVSVVLLAGALLLVRSFRNIQLEDLGMETRGVLAVRVPLTAKQYPTMQAYMDFFLRIEATLRSTPGVAAVGISESMPLDLDRWRNESRYSEIFADGKAAAPNGTGGTVVVRKVTPDYFKVLRIPIVAGRAFTDDDRNTGSESIILSQLLAARLFPKENAIGKHLQYATFQPYFSLGKQVFTVVGVAGNVKNAGLIGQDDPEYYEVRLNRPESWNRHTVVLIETSLPTVTVEQMVRGRIAQIDANAPVQIERVSTMVNKLADRPRFETALLSFFACTGLVMALIGLYGVVAFMAQQRTREIGIRIAVGANRGDVLRLILSEGVRLIVIGGAIGMCGSLALTRVLESVLFHVGPRDPATFVLVPVMLGIVALGAVLIPARSAMKTDPVKALRWE